MPRCVNILRVSDGSELRASDEQRERAAREIRDHFAAGRLTADELSERLDAVYRAKTEGDLRRLRADLPNLPATPAETRSELTQRRAKLRRDLIQHTGGALVPFLFCTAIWAMSGGDGHFWPAWVLLFALIPALRNGWQLYGPAPDLDRVEQDLARRNRRDARHARRGGPRLPPGPPPGPPGPPAPPAP